MKTGLPTGLCVLFSSRVTRTCSRWIVGAAVVPTEAVPVTKSWVWALVSLETRLSVPPGNALWKVTVTPSGVMSVSTDMPVPPVLVDPTAWERSVVVPATVSRRQMFVPYLAPTYGQQIEYLNLHRYTKGASPGGRIRSRDELRNARPQAKANLLSPHLRIPGAAEQTKVSGRPGHQSIPDPGLTDLEGNPINGDTTAGQFIVPVRRGTQAIP